jgi:acyl-coenzyme A synthetase/AMP-(fatty) acid ligase/acyl carrier protein
LFTGAAMVIAKQGGQKDNRYLETLIQNQNVTMCHFVPSMLEVFVNEAQESCKTLTKVLCSGEALKPSQVNGFREKFKHAELYNLYGPTEAAIDVTCWKVEGENIQTVPIGKPVANTKIYVLDKTGKQQPIGIPGEIVIGGVQVARGYHNKPELTKEKFINDPNNPNQRLYKTGDLGRWTQDGNIEYLGRIDEQVKIRGYRIELGEIEATIEQSGLVLQSVVVAKENKEGNKFLVAYVVSLSATSFEKEQAVNYLKEKLPDYMVPQIWVELEQLPLTPNGKVNRKALPEPDISVLMQKQYVAPTTEVEIKLAEIWQDVLEISKIGIHDNFFELGGHSLLALKLQSRIRRDLDFEIELMDIVQYPSIHGLASVINAQKS